MEINNILDRAKALGYPPLLKREIEFVEKMLDIHFEEDFYKIAEVCDYEYLLSSGYEFFNFSDEGDISVISTTLNYKCSNLLLEKYAVLATIDDICAILIKSATKEYPYNEIYLCTIYDLSNLFESKDLEEDPLIFPNFKSFFSHLLLKEEESIMLAKKE